MTYKRISFEHRSKSRFLSRWTVDTNTSEIRIEHSTRDNLWVPAVSVAVTNIQFVETTFSSDERWRIVKYQKDGESHQLVVEGPIVHTDEYYYKFSHERVSSGEPTRLATAHIENMPTVETVE